MSKIKPILFNTDMVRAILEGRKTVTRRVVKPQPEFSILADRKGRMPLSYWVDNERWVKPPYQPGDILYVREPYCQYEKRHIIDGVKYAYKANATPESERARKDFGYKWRPSIHMPREAARIFLRVTDVRVERLQNITDEEAVREGCGKLPCEDWVECRTKRENFSGIWDTTIKPKDRALYGWVANPYVWRIAFERCEKADEE